MRVCYIPYYFYPRPHMEGDAGDSGTITITISFLPTPSHEGDLSARTDIEGIGISTHALTWRATVLYFKMRHAATLISTHALTWRATCHRCARSPHSHISTHALTWRATCCDVGLSSKSLDFYPRPHMEGDESKLKGLADEAGFLPTPSHGGRPEAAGGGRSNAAFSTHALTWRATRA